MPKFKVVIHGARYMLRTTEKRFVLFSREILKERGFYTTRFVECENEDDAASLVFRMIETDFHNSGISSTDKSVLELEKIVVDDEGFDRYAPGAGFTFYSDDEDDDEGEI